MEVAVFDHHEGGQLDRRTGLISGTPLAFRGLGTRDAACATRGIPALASVADVTSCLARELACRTDQLLEHATPRFGELLDAAGVTLP